MTLSALGQAALDYAARGWKVFPLKPDSKEPLIPKRMGGKGHQDGTTDAAKIEQWWRVTPNANIGLNLIWSGLVCVDADTYDPACEWASFIAGRDLPATLTQQSASGGTHYLFRAPEGQHFAGKLCRRVDIKYDGYIVLEPSTFEGRPYRWLTDDDPADLPEWLVPKPEVPEPVTGASIDIDADDPRMRAYCDSAISAELGRIAAAVPGERNAALNQAAFSIGQIVGAGLADAEVVAAVLREACAHWPQPEKNAGVIRSALASGMATLRHFPMEDDPPYDEAEIRATVARLKDAFDRKDETEAAAIVAALRQAPPPEPVRADAWQLDMPRFSPRPAPAVAPLLMTAAEYRLIVQEEPPPFPIGRYVTDMPGLLGMVADYLDCASAVSTEAGALAVALPLLGAIMGRAYESPTKLRTNIYTVAIGASGTGKTSLVSPAKELMTLAKAGHCLGADDIASGPGLIKMLASGQPKVSFLDEFGHKLQQITSWGAGAHAKEILTQFTRLYSAANTLYTGTAKATESAAPIDCPHLCLFGMATPDQFWDAFGSGNLEDGSVARYIVCPIGQSTPKEPDRQGAQDVADAMGEVLAGIAERARGSLQTPVLRAGMTPQAERAYAAEVRTMDAAATCAETLGVKGGPAILRRVAENAVKIALVSAVGCDSRAPVIDGHDLDIGRALARWSAAVMIGNIASRIADNQYERDVNKMERLIREAGPEGILKGTLFNRMRSVNRRDLEQMLTGLCEADLVAAVKTPSTKSGLRLHWTGHGPPTTSRNS